MAHVIWHTAPGPSCGSGHVAPALLPTHHVPLVWQVMHAHEGGSASGNESVLERSENDTFLGVLTVTVIMTLDQISEACVCSKKRKKKTTLALDVWYAG